jgi:protocatechuate 3,4-dioxygenase alpha subunit
MALPPTPSQTVGPFFHFALLTEDRSKLAAPDHPSAIRLEGTVYDGAGEVVPDAMLEIWQADGAGHYVHPRGDGEGPAPKDGFSGFGRCGTDDEGRYEFLTIKPGPVPGPDGPARALQAPHIWVSVFARGLLKRAATRVYFPDEEEANAADPVLASIEDPGLRSTLVARPVVGDGALRFDIHLQGDLQTAFFDV